MAAASPAGAQSPVGPPLMAMLNTTGNMSGMATVPPMMKCARTLPHAGEFLATLSAPSHILLVMLIIMTFIILVIYIEEVIFIVKTFKIGYRKKKTIWLLAVFPVWSVCGLVGLMVPKSGPVVDMVCHAFFGSCLYQFGKLMISYMGGAKAMWKVIGMDRHINMNTLPVCCCCLCLPTMHFKPLNYFKLNIVIMQVAIVRPILWFIAAVMWSNNAFFPGYLSPRHSYMYIILCNATSTCTAVYSLMLLRNAFRPELEKKFFIIGKFGSIQLTLIIGTLPLVIASILAMKGIIGCGEVLTIKGRVDAIYHALLIIIMLPLSLLGRLSFRRIADGSEYAERAEPDDALKPNEAPNGGTGPSDDTKIPIDGAKDVIVSVPAKTTDPDESVV